MQIAHTQSVAQPLDPEPISLVHFQNFRWLSIQMAVE